METKKDEFKKYLDRTGVIDALTKALVSLYEQPEKPEEAIEYIQKYMGGSNIENIQKEKTELLKRNEALEKEVKQLREKLKKYESKN
ncbi:c-myc-binding protein [Anaeramoeba ignava]|uniref:C-myc-binding protein n=1 Tax=Anaeramoeba ignava TaxID=1746090 RepID=A0A9Q0R6A9_ANAIG|nr:c-myc-binding protein [Anaeramoeba ignava]KAJ5075412.1 c-myc-binding protein [Anaeramoeba ignava]